MHLGFLTIFWRDMLRFYRFKTLLISSLVQPALWMAFFGIAMSSNFNRFTSEIPPLPECPRLTISPSWLRGDRDDHALHQPLWRDESPL